MNDDDASRQRHDDDPDLVDKALKSFDHVLDIVHDKVVRPLLVAGRAIAFGFIIAVMVLVIVIVLAVGVVRLLNVYLFAGREWLSYLIIGAVSLVGGLLIWRRRKPVTLRK